MAYRKLQQLRAAASKFSLETEGVLCQTSTLLIWANSFAADCCRIQRKDLEDVHYFRAGQAITSALGRQNMCKERRWNLHAFPIQPLQPRKKNSRTERLKVVESSCIIKPWTEMTNHHGSHSWKLVNVSSQSLRFFATSKSSVQSSRVNGILSLIANASTSYSHTKSWKEDEYYGKIMEISMSQALKRWSKWIYMNCYV